MKGRHAVRELLAEPDFRRLLGLRLAGQFADGLFQAALVSAVLKVEPAAVSTGEVAKGARAVSSFAAIPTVENIPLPRAAAATVESVIRDVREALRGGRLDDALASTSLLLPSYESPDDTAGALVALDPARRSHR